MFIRLLAGALSLTCVAQVVVTADRHKVSSGYLFLAPTASEQSHLVDNDGKVIHSWPGQSEAGLAVKLLPDGGILRSGVIQTSIFFQGRGKGGLVEKRAWNGDLLWSYVLPGEDRLQHHDIEGMPNGNVLILAWEHRSKEQALAAGRRPGTFPDDGIWSEAIFEVKPTGPETGDIVWEWRAWDHLVQDLDPAKANFGSTANPRKINLNYTGGMPDPASNPDWLHLNTVSYNPKLDQILTSSRPWSELWIIDHSTSAEEAAGERGDLLYRYGNPAAHGAGGPADQKLINPHDPHWIAPGLPGAGHILVFNNGPSRGYSSADEIVPARDAQGRYIPSAAELVWTFNANAVTPTGGSAQRLPNGNTLICVSNANLVLEATPEREVVYRLNLGAGAAGGYTFRTARVFPDSAELRATPLAGPRYELVHGATHQSVALAPGALGILRGDAVRGPLTLAAATGGTFPVNLLRQGDNELQFVVPKEFPPGPARFSLSGENQVRDFRVNAVAPGLFGINGKGEGAAAVIVSRNGLAAPGYVFDEASKQFVALPIPLDGPVYLSLFGTGISISKSIPSVAVGGIAVPVLAEAALTDFPGVDQINIGPIPQSLAGKRNVAVVLTIDGAGSNTVLVSFQ